MFLDKKYRGVITPLVTPVTSDHKVDLPAFEKLLDFTVDAGTFPFILGTTGEIASNSLENRNMLAKFLPGYIGGRATTYSGITDNCVSQTIDTAKRYAGYGIDVMVVHLPYFFPLTDNLILNYFTRVAEESPAPIIIYNIKSITHTTIPVEIIEKLSNHPNIAGLKDSDRDFERVEKLSELFRDREDFSLFIGWTNKSSEALALGFDGIIPNTANLVPNLFQALYKFAREGNIEEALKLQSKAETLSELVQNGKTMTQTLPELKAILNELSICGPHVLPPLENLSAEDAGILLERFYKLDLNA